MSKTFAFSRLMLASVAATVLIAGTAQAGFEWKGTAPVAAAPASPASEGYPEPVIMWDGANAPMPAEKVGAVEAIPMPPAGNIPPRGIELAPSSSALVPNIPAPMNMPAPVSEMPLVPPPSAISAAPTMGEAGDVVAGFGSDLPLAIALQQIVPAGFQYGFGVGVNPGTAVSWEGGKPWKTVLGETLAPQGYTFVVDSNVIKVIQQKDAMSAMPMMNAAPADNMPNVTGIETMPQVAAPAPKASSEPVSIRRQKPSLLSRAKNLGNRMGGQTGPAVPAESASKPAEKKIIATKTAEQIPAKNIAVESLNTQAAPVEIKAMEKPEPVVSEPAPMSMPMPMPVPMPMPPAAPQAIEWDAPAAAPMMPPALPQALNKAPVDAPVEAPLNITRDGVANDMPSDMPVMMVAPVAPAQPPIMSPAQPAMSPVQPPVSSGITMAADTAPAATLAPATWHGARGQTLRDVLKNWSDVAGVELYWSIDYDYRLQQDVGYPGSYDEAVGRLLDLFAGVRPQPYGQLHQENGNGGRVLVIKSYDTAP